MPLARIFTRNPERTTDLSRQLQQQGYSVEVVSPDQAHLAPADLEIEFEVCERADVLERAGDLATELGADVAVAPGTLQPVVEPSRPAAPVAESVVEMKTPAPAERDPEREFENAFAPVIEMPAAVQATPPVIEVPVMEQEPLPPVAFLDEPAAVEPIAMPKAPQTVAYSEPPRPADPMPYLSQLTPFSTPAARTPEPQKAPPQPRPQAPQMSERGKKTLQDGARIAARTWAGALALTSSTAASVRDHFHEYKKRAQVRSAEARAAHAARLLDLEQRRAEAQQRAAELEAAREEAAARLMELVRQRDPGLHEEIRHEPGVPAQSTYAEDHSRQAQPIAASVRPPAVLKPGRAAVPAPINPWRRINPPLRAVLTGAAAVSALFIMGIALGLFHSRAPLANPANHASTQSGGVTVQTGGVTVQNAPAKPQPGKPAAGTQAQTKPVQPNAGAPAQAAAQTPGKPSPRIQQTQHMVAQQSEKAIGDDVVIRHFSRPVPTEKPKQAGQQAGLKHFSDLEN
jgi:hypothetical protein